MLIEEIIVLILIAPFPKILYGLSEEISPKMDGKGHTLILKLSRYYMPFLVWESSYATGQSDALVIVIKSSSS